MKVILLENIKKIGSIGEIIDVKRGFARNFLIANKKALYASKENINQVEKIKTQLSKKDNEKKAKLESNSFFKNWIYNSLKKNIENGNLKSFGSIKKGLIATGDSFISDENVINRLKVELPNLEAIEMEGGAVAQVAEQEGVPWVILRVISDSADSNSKIDFNQFLKDYVLVSWTLLESLLQDIPEIPNN